MNEDKSTRYQRMRRRVSVAALVWFVIALGAWTGSGAAVGLRRAVETLVGQNALVSALVVYVAVLVFVYEGGALVIGYYGDFLLDRRYGLSTQTLPGWLADRAKAAVVTYVFGVGASCLIYAIIRATGPWWWLVTGALFSLVFAALANLAPVLLLPLFYPIRPLSRDELRARLLRLAQKAGATVVGAYELGLSGKTRRANAALTGLGGTRRILVSDTMLADYSDDEIEVVLAHELAHHVHGDIWKGLVLESTLMLAGFGTAALALAALGRSIGLTGTGDIAGLPLLMLSMGAVSLVMRPAAHALSRAHERRADQFALELTGNPAAFVSAMRRLGQQNLAEHQPSRVVRWLFHSHPPIGERIAAANAFRG